MKILNTLFDFIGKVITFVFNRWNAFFGAMIISLCLIAEIAEIELTETIFVGIVLIAFFSVLTNLLIFLKKYKF